LEEINQIAPGPAPGVQDPHSRRYAAAQQLIEEVNVDLAELLRKAGHPAHLMS
jgi:hypothetical protein